MIVKELIKKLTEVDENLEVWLQIDSEGNGFRTIKGINDNCIKDVVGEYTSDISLKFLTPELKEAKFTEEDINETGTQILVIFP